MLNVQNLLLPQSAHPLVQVLFRGKLRSIYASVLLEISDMSAVDLIPCFPFLPTDGMSEDKKRFKMRQLQKETERLKAKFTNLVFDLLKSIEEKCTLDDLHSFLTFHDVKFEELLQGCKTIAEAFRKASKFWSFYDRDLIKLLMDRFGTTRNKEALGRVFKIIPRDEFVNVRAIHLVVKKSQKKHSLSKVK